MSILLESPVLVGSIGLVVVGSAAVAYQQTRGRVALFALAIALLLSCGALVGERLWQTPRERVQAAVAALFAAIEQNDLGAVLERIAASAVQVRADAETLMPQFDALSAGPGRIEVVLHGDTTATVSHKPLIRAQHKKTGLQAVYFDCLTIDFALVGDRWQVIDYTPAKDWRREAASLER